MAKMVFGVAIGAVIASLAFLAIRPTKDPVDSPDQQTSEANVRSLTAKADVATSDGQSDANGTRVTAPDSAVASERDSFGGDVDSSSLDVAFSAEDEEARLIAELEQAQDAASLAGDALADFRIGQSLAAREIVTPIRLPPEFDWVAERRYLNMFHEQFQREPVDTAWAAGMEAEFLEFIYANPDIVQRYGHPSVRCHSVRCEVLFSAQTRDDMRAPADARALMDGFLSQTPDAFDCEDYFCDTNANQQEGMTTIFWGVHRKREQLQSVVANAAE